MPQAAISLDDKYKLDATRAYMTGIEALVRLPMLQHQRDLAAGLNTAGFISGYRGSPLGGLDQALHAAQPYLDKHNIVFQPGINEDLAATAVWGSQQVNLFEGAKYDGVFALWYGKGPGVDRSMDVIKHGNAFGTAKYGGVLAIAGDDHACKSSTLPHQSEHMFIGASMPVLCPANVQEVLDLGIFGWELSRYSGCWVALKAITENMDSAISADIDPNRVRIVIPEDFALPPEGVHGRWPSTPLEQEHMLNQYRIYAARHFAEVNRLNKVVLDSPNARLGIITNGKSYMDVLQALDDLGIDEDTAKLIGLRVFKVGMSWPLEPVSTHNFAKGLEEILVVEEKRSIMEDQLTGQLYNWPVAERPRVVGEFDEHGRVLLTNLSELTPAMVARAIAARITRFFDSESIRERLNFLQAKEAFLAKPRASLVRAPHFCSGCPHNTSTKVPEGSRAMAGIGCHYMVAWMDRSTDTFAQMGGEGATWIGQAPFTHTPHIFQNLGDGTYHHSGLLAIRAAITAGVNITYKILYNDAVAMTGGQSVDGPLSVPMIVEQLRGEGVKHIALVSDAPQKYGNALPRAAGLSQHHRDELDAVQQHFRTLPGTTVIIYDQTCAAELRRRRKKGLADDPKQRVFIHEAVCEGCGDCSRESNCLSVLPKETELGRKRVIDQSACNKDFSCLKGFCPSFISVSGAELKKPQRDARMTEDFPILPEPALPNLHTPWNILVAGVGGTGVLTVSAIVAMAAYIEGKGCSSLNQTGLAQKFGAVISHVRVSARQEDIYAARIAAGDADLLLGCDLVVADSDEALAKLHRARSHAVVNQFEAPTSAFILNPDAVFPAAAMKASISEELKPGRAHFFNATELATALFGDSIASNMMLLGYAYQRGLVPVSAEAIAQAIALNNVAVEFNQQAFLWGRRAAHNLAEVERRVAEKLERFQALTDIDNIVAWRKNYLRDYQDEAYAARYEAAVNRIRAVDRRLGNGDHALSIAYARSLFKLMAVKDEYEVARLLADEGYLKRLKAQFDGKVKIHFHLAAPLISRRDPNSGKLLKRRYPESFRHIFKWLAKAKRWRGSAWDIFAYAEERRAEQALLRDFIATTDNLVAQLTPENYDVLVSIVTSAQKVRGFGHVKMKSIEDYYQQRAALIEAFHAKHEADRILAYEVA